MFDLKNRIRSINIIERYLCFRSVYSECTSFWVYLRYQLFPFFRKNKYWPIHKRSEVRGKVVIGKGARVGHRPGCVIQGRGKVFIGDYVGIGPNCIIISGNHDVYNQRDVIRKETIIGDYCWVASSAIILAGVVLGPRTIVGAGSVVTKSFPDGFCIIAGNPARVVKLLDKDRLIKEKLKIEFYGYIREDRFPAYQKKHLSQIKFEYDLSKVTENSLFWNK